MRTQTVIVALAATLFTAPVHVTAQESIESVIVND